MNGMPQGIVLAPLFFSMFVHDLMKRLNECFQYQQMTKLESLDFNLSLGY